MFPLVDAVYLSSVGSKYNAMLTKIQGKGIQFKMVHAVLCYICLLGLINYFIIKDKRDYKDAFFLGLGVYGVYEFTNAAIFEKWELWSVVIDTLWGGILFALVTMLTYKVDMVLNK
mgnify:FL=1|tara:strand:+ start:2114 stop:2461 length:348 start_codon:yes stop_codon:yes gene_type:complete